MRLILIAIICILSFTACETLEGEGGTSEIKGKVFVRDFDSDGDLKDEYYPGEWPVYIIYGESDIYNDKMDTHFDGGFNFSSLYPGNYTVFTYSKCNSCPGDQEVVSINVVLERNAVVNLDDLIVKD